MNILPPSYSFNGDKLQSKLYKSIGLKLYNSTIEAANREGLTARKVIKDLGDGRVITVNIKKHSIYDNWSGVVDILSSSTTSELEYENIRALAHYDFDFPPLSYSNQGEIINTGVLTVASIAEPFLNKYYEDRQFYPKTIIYDKGPIYPSRSIGSKGSYLLDGAKYNSDYIIYHSTSRLRQKVQGKVHTLINNKTNYIVGIYKQLRLSTSGEIYICHHLDFNGKIYFMSTRLLQTPLLFSHPDNPDVVCYNNLNYPVGTKKKLFEFYGFAVTYEGTIVPGRSKLKLYVNRWSRPAQNDTLKLTQNSVGILVLDFSELLDLGGAFGARPEISLLESPKPNDVLSVIRCGDDLQKDFVYLFSTNNLGVTTTTLLYSLDNTAATSTDRIISNFTYNDRMYFVREIIPNALAAPSLRHYIIKLFYLDPNASYAETEVKTISDFIGEPEVEEKILVYADHFTNFYIFCKRLSISPESSRLIFEKDSVELLSTDISDIPDVVVPPYALEEVGRNPYSITPNISFIQVSYDDRTLIVTHQFDTYILPVDTSDPDILNQTTNPKILKLPYRVDISMFKAGEIVDGIGTVGTNSVVTYPIQIRTARFLKT